VRLCGLNSRRCPINRGVAYANLNQYEKAISDYTEAIRLKPDYAEAYQNRGIAYVNLKQKSSYPMSWRNLISLLSGDFCGGPKLNLCDADDPRELKSGRQLSNLRVLRSHPPKCGRGPAPC